MPDVTDTIALEYCETLASVTIDEFAFRVTWHPVHRETCILWFRDTRVSADFEALGQFSTFDRRRVLDFIVRYSTTAGLRQEIDRRRFAGRLKSFDRRFFTRLERLSSDDRIAAFRELFDLDEVIERRDLAMKWRILAKHYHPDVGGDDRIMGLINEAYQTLVRQSDGPRE